MNKAASQRLLFLERQTDMFGGAETSRSRRRPASSIDTHDLLSYEKEAFGFYFSSHPLEPYRAEYEALNLVHRRPDRDDARRRQGVAGRGHHRCAGRARTSVTANTSSSRVEDFDGSIEVMIFSDQLEACRAVVKIDNLVAVQGTVKVRAADATGRGQGVPQVWADRVMAFKDCSRYLKGLVIVVPASEAGRGDVLLKMKERLEEHPGNRPRLPAGAAAGRQVTRDEAAPVRASN